MEKIEPIRKLIKEAAKSIDQPKQVAASLPLTRVQVHAIDFLSNQPDCQVNQHQFDQEMGVQRSTITVMLQRLEKKGLVTRLPDPTDKRQKLVALTPAGKDLVPKLKEVIINDDLQLKHQFTEDELAATRKVLMYIKQEG